jgi:hypothetical protein
MMCGAEDVYVDGSVMKLSSVVYFQSQSLYGFGTQYSVLKRDQYFTLMASITRVGVLCFMSTHCIQ